MKTNLNRIGIETHKSVELGQSLNLLLADFQLYYQNLHGYHWNIKGDKYFELHLKFEEYYNKALLRIDEIAERILTLGVTPAHTFNDYIRLSEVPGRQDVTSGSEALKAILDHLFIIIRQERKILSEAATAYDEGTVTLMSDYIVMHEKQVWMISAYLGN
jgi:starvation-inducible DNA-binding protein